MDNIKKIINFLNSMIVIVFIFFTMVIALSIYFDFTVMSIQVDLIIKLIISLSVAILLYAMVKKHYVRIKNYLDINMNKLLLIFIFVMLITQLIICFYGMFVSGWDVDTVAKGAIIYNNPADPHMYIPSYYFSRYPNNLLILWITYNVLKVSNYIGSYLNLNTYHITVFCILFINAILNSIAGYLTFKTVQDITKNNVISSIVLIGYAVFIGTSFWILVPYTDSMGLIFPILMFRIYQIYKNKAYKTNKTILLFWIVLGFIFYVGFKTKPQTAVMFIAIIIMEIFNFIISLKNYKTFLIKVFSVLITIVISTMIFNGLMIKSINIILDKDQEFGITHFAMMGLNEKSIGGFHLDDVTLSKSYPNKKERAKGNVEVIIQRVKNFGPDGLMLFLAKKTNVNFLDGTFSWGKEGQFYMESIHIPSKVIGPIIKSFYYNGEGEFYGSNYKIHENIKNGVWLIILFGLPFSSIIYKRKKDDRILLLHLSLIGITLFLTLFESRSRYLYTFSPIFLIVGFLGLNEFFKLIKIANLIKSK